MWQKTIPTNAGPLMLAVAAIEAHLPAYPLTPAETEILAGLRHPIKRVQWLTARHTLQQLLQLPAEVGVLNHPGGKPYLSNHQQPISLSHTDGYVAVVEGSSPQLGVDIEARGRARNPDVARLFMSPGELSWFGASPRLVHFLALWSAKESLYKAFCQGDGEIVFKDHLLIETDKLSLPEEIDVPFMTTLTAHLLLPGRPAQVAVGLEVHPAFVLTYVQA